MSGQRKALADTRARTERQDGAAGRCLVMSYPIIHRKALACQDLSSLLDQATRFCAKYERLALKHRRIKAALKELEAAI